MRPYLYVELRCVATARTGRREIREIRLEKLIALQKGPGLEAPGPLGPPVPGPFDNPSMASTIDSNPFLIRLRLINWSCICRIQVFT